MNKYDEIFSFDIASIDNALEIMDFIKAYWDSKHILANDKAFFLYHYKNVFDSDKLNILVMRKKDSNEICGILGFVLYGKDDLGYYFSGSVTKVRDDLSIPMAGLELMKRLYKYFNKYVELACGANEKTIVPLFKKLFRYECGIMDLYFLPNLELNNYKIIKFDKSKYNRDSGFKECKQCTLHRIYNLDSIPFDFYKRYDGLPFKDIRFLNHRYFLHPIFKYLVYAIKDSNEYEGILFFREATYLDSKILILADFIGKIESLGNIADSIYALALELKVECVHLLVNGINESIFKKAGFIKVDIESSEVIVPTYFEPFLQKNIRNAYVKSRSDMAIFKAAGDQDNPKYNLVNLDST